MTCLLSFVAARGLGNEIGERGLLPWKMPGDLRRFKAITLDHAIIMGSRTYLSVGRPLPRRLNIVVSRNPAFAASGCTVVTSLKEAMASASAFGEEAMLVGGSELFREALPLCGRMYLTTIGSFFPQADTFFPALSVSDWTVSQREAFPASEQDPYPCVLERLERKAL